MDEEELKQALKLVKGELKIDDGQYYIYGKGIYGYVVEVKNGKIKEI